MSSRPGSGSFLRVSAARRAGTIAGVLALVATLIAPAGASHALAPASVPAAAAVAPAAIVAASAADPGPATPSALSLSSAWIQSAYLKASNTDADDYYGSAVAVSGNTIVVGSGWEASAATGINGDQGNTLPGAGAVYVLTRTGATWTQQAYLKASNPDAFDLFGYAVAISGDTVVVGAPSENSAATGVNGNQASNAADGAGAAYVFTRSGTTWTQQAYLKASNTGAGDGFGAAVAISGNTIAVSAPYEASAASGVNGNGNDNSATNAGAAYIFTRSGTTWSQQAYLKASNPGIEDVFGRSIGISGDTAVVGAIFEDSAATGINGNQADNSANGAGAAYVFARSGTTWSQQAYLKGSNTGAIDTFGASVAVSGNTIIAGAPGEDSDATGVNGNQASEAVSASGAAYVYTRSGTAWTQQAYLKASHPRQDDVFGTAVAIDGNTAAVGAKLQDGHYVPAGDEDPTDTSTVESGAVYPFARTGTTWAQTSFLKARGAGADDRLGSVVAVSADTIVAGAPQEDSGATGVDGNSADDSAHNAGAAQVYTLAPDAQFRVPSGWPNATQRSRVLSFEINFSVPVTGLTSDDFVVHGTAGGCSVLPIAGSLAEAYAVGVRCSGVGSVSLTMLPNAAVTAAGVTGPFDETTSAAVSISATAALPGEATLAAGGHHSCAILDDGTVRCWGRAVEGQLGGSSTAQGVAGITTAVQVVTGVDHTCVLLENGDVRCWGSNAAGQTSDGSVTTPVSGIGPAVAIAAGERHTCAAMADGTVRCWGLSSSGQLGGVAAKAPIPVILTATGVTAGWYHSCALLFDKTVHCWGDGAKGQLGGSSFTTPVALYTTTSAFDAGGRHTCAMQDANVYCWGLNATGQLGNGGIADSPTPVAVQSWNIAGISAGAAHTCLRTIPGEVECWGYNGLGQLGIGTLVDVDGPNGVPTIAAVTGIAAGAMHTCARTALGGIRCWGDNTDGQLGDGTTILRTRPVRVADIGPAPATAAITANATPARAPAYQVIFDRPVTGLEAGDFTLSGSCTVAALAGANANYGLTLGSCGAGQVTVTLKAGSVVDASLDTAPAAPVTNSAAFVDLVAPTVGFAGPASPTNAAALAYTLTFSEAVIGLVAGDFSIAEAGTGCVVGTPTGPGATWHVSLTGCAEGNVTLSLKATAVTDLAGNANAATSAATVRIDRTKPTVAIGVSPEANPSTATSFVVTAVFSEVVTGFAAGDVSLGGSTGWAVSGFSGLGDTYTFVVSGANPPDGDLSITIPAGAAADAAGNTNAGAARSLTLDRTAPTVTLAGPVSPTADALFAYRLTFSEPVTGLTKDDVAVTGSADCLGVTVSGAGNDWTVSITGCREGTLDVRLSGGAVSDAAGNVGPASDVVADTVTIDRTAPTVTITGPAATSATNPAFTLTFNEPVTGLSWMDLAVGGTAASCALNSVTGAGTAWTVMLANCAEGTVTVTLAQDSVKNARGADGPVASVTSPAITIDRAKPTVGAFQAAVEGSVTVGTTTGTLRISWTSTDGKGSGVDHTTVETSKDKGVTWSLPVGLGTRTTSTPVPITFGKTVRYRITAIDLAGNASTPLVTPVLTPSLVQQTTSAFKYSGTWKSASSSKHSGSSVKYSVKAGSSVTFKTSARAIGFITTRGKDRGAVKVYINGKYSKTIDLRATSTGYRWLAWSTSATSAKAWTIKLVVVGTRGRPRVDIDGFVVVK